MRNIERRIETPGIGLVTVAPIVQSNPMDQITPELYAERMETIGYDAWSQAQWVAQVAGSGMREEVVKNVFDPSDNEKVKQRASAITLGVDAEQQPVRYIGVFDGDTHSPERLLGFASLQTEVSPSIEPDDNAPITVAKTAVRGMKRIYDATIGFARAGRVYDVIQNLQIDPNTLLQGQGIGTALLYGVLLNATLRRSVTALVDVHNEPMKRLLEKSDFTTVDTKKTATLNRELLGGYRVMNLRYITGHQDPYGLSGERSVARSSAGMSHMKMAHDMPWLEKQSQKA
jgi:ribosomal protein S18 acetylase RimI-like enzyme